MRFVLAACALPVPTVWNILRGERDAVFTRGLGVVDVGREGGVQSHWARDRI